MEHLRFKRRGYAAAGFTLLAVLSLAGAVTASEQVDDPPVGSVLTLVHLGSLYALTFLFLTRAKSGTQRARWQENAVLVAALLFWSLMLVEAVIGDLRKRQVTWVVVPSSPPPKP